MNNGPMKYNAHSKTPSDRSCVTTRTRMAENTRAMPQSCSRWRCSGGPTRCQVPAMAYIFGMPERGTKTLRIRYTWSGQRTPGAQASENSIADMRCELPADHGH